MPLADIASILLGESYIPTATGRMVHGHAMIDSGSCAHNEPVDEKAEFERTLKRRSQQRTTLAKHGISKAKTRNMTEEQRKELMAAFAKKAKRLD